MSDPKPKIYPIASLEVAKMLGIDTSQSPSNAASSSTDSVSAGDLPVAGLPVVEAEVSTEKPAMETPAAEKESLSKSEPSPSENEEEILDLEEKKVVRPVWLKIVKTAAPYLIVFAVAVFLYYFFFSQVNIGASLAKSIPKKVETAKESVISSLAKQNSEAYYAWVSKFYYDVSDSGILDPFADNSGNGLSNFQKYLLNLNPCSYDTLGLGMSDSEAIAQGINPLTGSELTQSQKSMIDQYFDMEVVANRLALANLHNTSRVAGARVGLGPLRDPNYNYIYEESAQSAEVVNESGVEVDITIPGRLEIPELNINVPIIWTQDPKDFENDLQLGVVHYPGTALPGQIGTTYISGHSSNYAWAKGDFKRVFAKLGDLPDNTSFKVTVVQKNGKDAILHYVVTHRQEFGAIDQEQFKNSGKSVIALSTCWPVGSTAKRLVVFAELTQVSK